MDLNKYINREEQNFFFTQQQGSDFAKKVAGDFNPIHDVGSKKFIVPGDLLFSILLQQFGLHKKMQFNFSGMVRDNTRLHFTPIVDDKIGLLDAKDKEYMSCQVNGDKASDEQLVSDFTRAYVSFSAKAFPHLLVPLMKEKKVMINVARPLVIYESMSIELDQLDISQVQLELNNTRLDVTGKRGRACLQFDIISADKKVGCGKKYMLLTALREYNQGLIDRMINEYKQIVLEH